MAAIPWTIYSVGYKVALDDAEWTDLPDVKCTELTRGLAPTIDQASLEHEFGTIDGAYRSRLDLRGKFVRITLSTPLRVDGEIIRDENGDIIYAAVVDWVGFVTGEQLHRWPEEAVSMSQRLRGGDQTFIANGLEWFLARQTINSSVVYDGTDDGHRIDRVLGFNTGFGDGRDIEYTDRGNADTEVLGFARDKDHAALWKGWNIVRYLLHFHPPKDKDGNESPCNFALDLDNLEYLFDIAPTLRCDGNSVWQALNAVIAQNRGLTWWLRYDDDTNTAYVMLSSQAVSSIALPGGGTLPAAKVITSIADLDGIEGTPQIAYDEGRYYDQIVCRGAFKRSVFTVAVSNGTLEKSWSDAEETAYLLAADDADPAVNDRVRQQNRFERVFSMFHIPTDWDGDVAEGVHACPKFSDTGSIIGSEPLHLASLRLLPSMPLKVGYDYTDATAPVAADPTNIRPEFAKPFAIVDVDTDDWRFTHRINVTQDEGGDKLTSYWLAILNGTPGFQLLPSGGMPHCLAGPAFDEGDPGTAVSEYAPEIDYENMRCTVCGEWDAYCEGTYPGAIVGTPKPARILYINIGERARFDWLAEGTDLDINEDGTRKTVTTAGALRDDTSLCRDYARLAYDWYGVTRATLQLNYEHIDLPVELGDLITTIGTGAAAETVNAVVSQISINPESGKASILAGYAELDFAEL
jgi:hypothetical protein